MVAASTSASQLVEVLEDLSTRFILNLPTSELSSIPRIIFQVEQAYWYYSDHVQPSHPQTLPTCTLKTFSSLLFQVCPLLEQWEPEHEKVFVEFMKYKSKVPVCGAILVSEGWDKVLMVRGWKGSTWGWPKGKINQNEEKHVCAAREVLEETGFDPTSRLNPKHFVEVTVQDQRVTLFIVPHVPVDFPFLTQTRKEIGAIEWFRVKDLPGWKKRAPGSGVVDEKERATYSRNAHGNKFYLTTPFVGHLKKWIKAQKPLASSATTPPSPPTNSLPSPIVTPAAVSPSLVHAEVEGPEGGTKEGRLSELDELFERFLKDSTARPTSSSDDDDSAPSGGHVEGASRLNELLAGLRVREDTASTVDSIFSATTNGTSSSSSSIATPNFDARPLAAPSPLLQQLFQSQPPHQRLDDRNGYVSSPPQHQHLPFPSQPLNNPSLLNSHGVSLLSLLQSSSPSLSGIHSNPGAQAQGAPLPPPRGRADKEKKLLELLESSLQATEVDYSPSTPRYASSGLPGSPHVMPLYTTSPSPSPLVSSHLPIGHIAAQVQQPSFDQPQRRSNLLDILNSGNGSGLRDGLYGSPRAAHNRTPTTQQPYPTPPTAQPHSYPLPQAPPHASPSTFQSSPLVSNSAPMNGTPQRSQAAQSHAILSLFNTPPPSSSSHVGSPHAAFSPPPYLHSNGQHGSPTPPPALLSNDKQHLLNILGSPPAQQTRSSAQHLLSPQQQPSSRASVNGDRERMLLNLLGGGLGSPAQSSTQVRPSNYAPAFQEQQQQQPQGFNSFHREAQPSHHPSQNFPPQVQHQQGFQQALRPSSGPHGQPGGLLDILNSAGGASSPVRKVAQMDRPGYPTGSPITGVQGIVPGRGVNGLPLFGM